MSPRPESANHGPSQTLTRSIDPLLNVTEYVFDDLYRLVGLTDANGDTTTFGYDLVGNRTRLTDAEMNTTTWIYDDLDRMTHWTNEYGDSRVYQQG